MATVVWITSNFLESKAQCQEKEEDSSQSQELPHEQSSPGPTALLQLHLLQVQNELSHLLLHILGTLPHALQRSLIQPIPGLLRVLEEGLRKQEKERNGWHGLKEESRS